ncbi:Oidioi.mRNA.OKI2018_I69.chr2.g5994.t2.cds [Oikopleura dioica]|uniref:Oidioi.mRNA.OKI2018_I69.chr2.g5994.t2.cds n=1 Tax=Oikopleura dioica TaxID=34765 RepID=A0ABN7T5I8_OIKDI|nr:Oidioi.mRNA.OKI2018_I69.chr2.g5994.t2.cds [Oikopleura dioica]
MRGFYSHPQNQRIHYILAFIAVIVVVVGIREIYTNVEKEASQRNSCIQKRDFEKQEEYPEIFDEIYEDIKSSSTDQLEDSLPLPSNCYIYKNINDASCLNLGIPAKEAIIYSKCLELDNDQILQGGWEFDTGVNFSNLKIKDSCEIIDIFTTEEMTLENSSISHENLLQYILGGVVGGLLILTLLIFITMKVIIPKLCPRNPTATRVIQNLGGTVVINERNSNLPGMADLPPEYGDIENYPKDDPVPSRPPRAGEAHSNPAFSDSTTVVLPPPQYSEINSNR